MSEAPLRADELVDLSTDVEALVEQLARLAREIESRQHSVPPVNSSTSSVYSTLMDKLIILHSVGLTTLQRLSNPPRVKEDVHAGTSAQPGSVPNPDR